MAKLPHTGPPSRSRSRSAPDPGAGRTQFAQDGAQGLGTEGRHSTRDNTPQSPGQPVPEPPAEIPPLHGKAGTHAARGRTPVVRDCPPRAARTLTLVQLRHVAQDRSRDSECLPQRQRWPDNSVLGLPSPSHPRWGPDPRNTGQTAPTQPPRSPWSNSHTQDQRPKATLGRPRCPVRIAYMSPRTGAQGFGMAGRHSARDREPRSLARPVPEPADDSPPL